MNNPGYLTSAQLQSLATEGYDIQNHTQTHADLSTLTYADAFIEVGGADSFISSATGKKPEFFAYPYGRTDATARTALRDVSVKMSVFAVIASGTPPPRRSEGRSARNRHAPAAHHRGRSWTPPRGHPWSPSMQNQSARVIPPEPESSARPELAECPQLEALTVESLIVPALQAQLEAIWPQEVDLLLRYPLPAAPALLDVGCGTGEFVARLAELWPEARITGVDLAPTLLDIARRRTAASDRVTYRQENGAHLPFEDDSLHGVFCRHVLHAVSRPELILDEMSRVLKPGGVLHLLVEDYGMLYSSRRVPDLDRLWREGWIAAGENSGIDLRIGRKVPAMLLHRRMRDVRMNFAQVDSLRVNRSTLWKVFQHWKAFANDWVVKNSSLSANELNALHDDLLATLDDPNEHVLWMVPLISAVKPS